ncbi:MAG: bifunctional diaminohydroxyphosphoribosylaminopyrimidine deaminase/5-amino-6-(5-phosphoribosylamino)uracil reductase RibD [Candidatus Eremiobacteraeota bacterium]|nr:bifunctional diaminohydroxyphosphoribosylaminopyrimidine deaminase/5-amino-6-(5-phosphoribosylamino)uracil reductase RibD [Candidatus Eremiobacteraeota bacterium]
MQRLNPLDRLYLSRAYELARRAAGNTSPNPMVGAVVVADGEIAGEGFHHRAGEPHAEVNALEIAGERARGATMYVSLEPCNHFGRTPPCAHAVVDAGISRVIVGALDPNPKTNLGGVAHLHEHGVAVEVADDPEAQSLIEPFAAAIRSERPFVTLKMAVSLDGYVSSRSGKAQWLTGEEARAFVRELRIEHDAVMVGAGTIRVDNSQLTVRPPHRRLHDYVRVVLCETDSVDPQSAVFDAQENYEKTIVMAPAGAIERFRALEANANLRAIGPDDSKELDLTAALRELRAAGISSVLCEGGPTFAGHLLAGGFVDRVHWLIAPRFLRSDTALPALADGDLASAVRGVRVDRVERLGPDTLISGTIERNV